MPQPQPTAVPTTAVDRLDARIGPWPTGVLVAVVSLALLWLHAYPPIDDPAFWTDDSINQRLINEYAPMCVDPLTEADITPTTRARILGPAIAYAVGLRGVSGAIVPAAAALFAIVLLYRLLRDHVAAGTAALATLAMTLTPLFATSLLWPGYQDGLGAIALLLCLRWRQPAVLFAVMAIGMLAQERIAAAIPLILLWHALFDAHQNGTWLRRSVVRGLALTAAVAAWWAVRAAILSHVGVLDDVNAGTWQHVTQPHWNTLDELQYVPAGLVLGLRSAWAWIGLVVLLWWFRRPSNDALPAGGIETNTLGLSRGRLLGGLGLLAGLAILVPPALMVLDISRVASLAMPAAVIALVWLHRERPLLAWHATIVVALLHAMLPMYQVIGTHDAGDRMGLYLPRPPAVVYWLNVLLAG